MKSKMVLCILLLSGLGVAILPQGGQAQAISWDALSVTGHDSHYKAFYQTLPLWQLGRLAVEGGMGVTAWRECGWWSCWWYTYPSLLAGARHSLFTAPKIDVYSLSWLSASFSHEGRLLPIFHRVDLFTSIGIDFRLSPSLSIHGELGFPIGWDRICTAIVMGFSLRL